MEIINIDVAEGVKRYMTIVLSCYGGFLVIFFVVCAMGFAPVASGGQIGLNGDQRSGY